MTALTSMSTSLKTIFMDIFTCPSALWSIKFLENNGGQASQKLHGSQILDFTDPAIANTCVNCHVVLHGDLLPAVKFMHHPLHCFNCHHTGHFACSCRARGSCGLCVGDHYMRHCGILKKDRPADQLESTPLKCAVCSSPHATLDKDAQLVRLPSTNIGLKLHMQVPSSQYPTSTLSQAPSWGAQSQVTTPIFDIWSGAHIQ